MDDAHPKLVSDNFSIGDIPCRKTGWGVGTLIGCSYMEMMHLTNPLQHESTHPMSMLVCPFSELTPASAQVSTRLKGISRDTEFWTLPFLSLKNRSKLALKKGNSTLAIYWVLRRAKRNFRAFPRKICPQDLPRDLHRSRTGRCPSAECNGWIRS